MAVIGKPSTEATPSPKPSGGVSGVSEMPGDVGGGTGTTGGTGLIALPGYGEYVESGTGMGENRGNAGGYSTLYANSATEIKNLFISLWNSKDERIIDFVNSVGNYKAAEKIWNKGADYAMKLALGNQQLKNNSTVNFFNVLSSSEFTDSVATSASSMNYVSLTDSSTARADLLKDMETIAGRKPTEAEYKDYVKKLNAEQRKNPTRQFVSGSTQTTTRSAFDEDAFRTSYIVNKLNLSPEKVLPGKARETINLVDTAASDFGVSRNITQKDRTTIAKQLLTGEMDEVKLRQRFADIAASAFPVFADRLKAGEGSLRQIAQPYIATYANMLELDDNAVDLKDVVNKATNSMNGKPELHSLFDYERLIRKDDRYQYTKQANEEAVAFGKAFARAMGVNL